MALFVDGDNFTVHNGGIASQSFGDCMYFGKVFRLLVLVARDHPYASFAVFVEEDYRSVAVPLDLEEPVVIVERFIYQGGQHRTYGPRHRCLHSSLDGG